MALADLNRVVAVNPNNAAAYFERGIANMNLGMLDDAQTDLESHVDVAGPSSSTSKEATELLRQLENGEVPAG